MMYDKHCLHLSKEEVEANLAGKPFVIRQNIPKMKEQRPSMMSYTEISRWITQSLMI